MAIDRDATLFINWGKYIIKLKIYSNAKKTLKRQVKLKFCLKFYIFPTSRAWAPVLLGDLPIFPSKFAISGYKTLKVSPKLRFWLYLDLFLKLCIYWFFSSNFTLTTYTILPYCYLGGGSGCPFPDIDFMLPRTQKPGYATIVYLWKVWP